jgi:predicted dehydrogenase
MAPLRLAMIGAGWTGQRQTEAARELGDAIEIVALVDSDRDFVEETAATLAIERTETDLRAVLDDPGVDAVSICTPHALHAPMAIAAAAAGKHILVTKPMATTVAEASDMIGAAEASGVTLFVAEHEPYEVRYTTLREIVSSGKYLGELTFAACIAGHQAQNPAYPGRRAWLAQPEAGGTGVWALLGVHAVAALRHVLGEIVTVYMLDHHASSFARNDIEATMSGVVELESGVVVHLVQTTETQLRPRLNGLHLYGDAGTVIAGEASYVVYPGAEDRDVEPATHDYPAATRSPYAEMLQAFVDAIAGTPTGPTTASSERRTLAVIEAGYESARTRTPIDLNERYPAIW